MMNVFQHPFIMFIEPGTAVWLLSAPEQSPGVQGVKVTRRYEVRMVFIFMCDDVFCFDVLLAHVS
jgi:hypothetical protein